MVSGVVQRISEKPWQGKIFYSFALSGQEGWYNTGMKRPPNVGTSVKFNDKTNNKGFKEVDGPIQIVTDQEVGPAGPIGTVAAQSDKSGGGSQSAYWNRKESRDIVNDAARELGATRNTAISLIDLGIKYEVFKLPAAAKREEFLWALLDKYTKKLMGKEESEVKENEQTDKIVEVSGEDWS